MANDMNDNEKYSNECYSSFRGMKEHHKYSKCIARLIHLINIFEDETEDNKLKALDDISSYVDYLKNKIRDDNNG